MAVGGRSGRRPADHTAARRGAIGRRLRRPHRGDRTVRLYERAREAFAVVATGEMRLYGNLILKKGVIRPDQGRTAVMRIDSHQHFWRPSRGDYGWIRPDLTAIYADFLPPDLRRGWMLAGSIGR